MKRSFNFTGNRKIDGCFTATFDDKQNPLLIKASINPEWKVELSELNPQFEVLLAASDVLRFDYRVGLLADVLATNGFNILLKDFNLEGVKPQVDLRIVDLETKKIEASAENIIPEQSPGTGRRSFVKLSVTDAIGKQIWRVRWESTDSVPILQLNAAIPDVERKFCDTSQLATVIMPQVLRQILLIMLMSKYDEETGVLGESAGFILSFCEKFIKSDPPPSAARDFNEVSLWVDEVISNFAKKIDATTRFHYPPEPVLPN